MFTVLGKAPSRIEVVGDLPRLLRWVRERFDVFPKIGSDPRGVEGLEAGQIALSLADRISGKRACGVVNASAEDFLSTLLSSEVAGSVDRVFRKAPTFLFRVASDPGPVIDEILELFPGRVVSRETLFDGEADSGVFLGFTAGNCRGLFRREALFERALLLEAAEAEVRERLENLAMPLFNRTMEGNRWDSMEIRIYDAYEEYDLQVRRLARALEYLDIGFTLGHERGRDFGHILIPLNVFRLRLATFRSTEDVKRVLMALEYDGKGNCLADFDLYRGKKKVGWTDLPVERKLTRAEVGSALREEIFGGLTCFQRLELCLLEERIIGARTPCLRDV